MKKQLYFPGDYICESEGYIKGYGTECYDNSIFSSYFGTVQQINKLITVTPVFSFRYTPEVGDVVIGKVTQIYNKKWKLEMNSKGDCTLGLGSINLPGVMQRRKSEDDEINMSKFFDINDLVVCEIQKVNKNGSAALHTRNDKYGRLSDGVLCIIRPDLIKPMKTRFASIKNVNIIWGANGYIWISCKDENFKDLSSVSRIRSFIENANRDSLQIDPESLLSIFNSE